MADTIDNFVHLHVHSEYSMLDGLGRIKNLVKQAQKLGQPALALTDHGVMHGAIEFFRACKDGGIKPLIGLEAYETVYGRPMDGRDSQLDKNNYHLLLLARNMDGYRNLMKIASHSQLNGYYYKPRVDHDLLAKHANGLICTTGCLGAEVPNLLLQGKDKEAYDRLGWYCDVFGKENFFVELQEHSIDELRPVNKQLIPWAKEFGLKLLPTNDVHYVGEKDGGPHDVLLCVQTGVTVHETKRMKMSDGSYFIKSRAQMEETFRPFVDLPGYVFDHTLQVAEMCEVDLEDPTYHLPDLPIPEGHTYDSYLRELTEEGLHRLYGERANSEAIQERKERELRVIAQMGFSIYFLIVADLCNFARSRNIWWNVRGSGAGSVVAYCIGITGLDPLKNNLIFERFLNPGRVSMPDFDLDFPDDQREEMIKYTIQRFGESQVAQIATFNRMKAKAAVRDVGRAQGIELAKVDRIAKLIPGIPGKPVFIQDCLTEGHEFYSAELLQLYNDEQWVRELLETAKQLEGVARNSGIHAAAVIVADKDLIHYTPLMRSSKSAITSTVAQYEFPILESIGLLKVDFLGLSTLSVMREACRLIKERHGIEFTLQNIPFEGEPAKEAFKLLSSGEVSGVFQVESQGMRRVLTEMKPTMFEHIIAMISLYRPGPIEYIPSFIQRMHGKEIVEYKHPELESILAETYGICVSGDAMVINAKSGQRCRLDELGNNEEFWIQGVDANWQPAIGQVAHWIDNGIKPVYRVTLRNGASIKVTVDHRLLTEDGWQPLNQLAVGNHIATPLDLIGPDEEAALHIDHRKLRVLAYLIADGSLASLASVDFVSKDQSMINEYVRCLSVFGNVRPVFTEQIRQITRVGVAKSETANLHYHTPTTLLAWMRELGLKHTAGSRPGGLRSHEKFVPRFVFELSDDDITFFLASLWDCDGYMGRKLCHYKTISKQLADDVQTLLLRLGIRSTIHTAQYVNPKLVDTQSTTSYQVTVYDTKLLAQLLQPFMLSPKKSVLCTGQSSSTIRRGLFLAEVANTTQLTARGLIKAYGIDRQHFYAQRRNVSRISSNIASILTDVLDLPETKRHTNVDWQEIVTIEPAGEEHVYDLTVEGLHNFVANNIIVHNCVYQEQIIQILSKLAGYTPGEADLVRRAVSKKKASDIEKHKKLFVAGCEKNNISADIASDIYADIEFFARYGFNKSHAADYAVITVQTAYLKAHYPVEYMAAQLLIERDKTEKVTNFLTECRRMGIDVLPPDVTYSNLDFDIQLIPPGTQKIAQRDPSIAYPFPVPEGAAIRFGMAAIKNVGEGPVQVILEGRKEGGPFKSLEDFASRVDLRKINKRALECLIKAGCFDSFGKRSQLLEVIDGMVSNSGAAWDAQESGQLSIFDLFGDGDAKGNSPTSVAPIKLPDIEEVKGKEKLQWEKELLGVYSISHPLNSLGADLSRVVTCSCSELDERYDGKNILLGGLISNIRTITTKKGDPMAFVQLEDLQGSCEVVFFPKTYAELKEQLQPDTVMLIKGKAQTREGRTSLLADGIQRHIDKAIATGQDPANQYQRPLLDTPTINGMNVGDSAMEGGVLGARAFSSHPLSMGLPGVDDEFVNGDESSPFAGDMPAWLSDVPPPPLDDDDEAFEGEPLSLAKLPPPPPALAQKPASNGSSAVGASATGAVVINGANKPLLNKGAELAPTPPAKTVPSPEPAKKSLPDTSLVWYDFDARKEMEDARREEARAQGTGGEKEKGRGGEGETGKQGEEERTSVSSQPEQQVLASEASVSTNAMATNATATDATATHMLSTDTEAVTILATVDRPIPTAPANPLVPPVPTTGQPVTDDVAHRKPTVASNGHLNGHGSNGKTRHMRIALRRSGDIERDKYRLKQIYDAVCDPRGRDHFSIKLVSETQSAELSFPNDGCTISDKLTGELTKHFRVEVVVEE